MRFWKTSSCAVRRRDHGHPAEEGITLTQLARLPILRRRKQLRSGRNSSKFWAQHIALDSLYELMQMETILNGRAGLGAAILPSIAIQGDWQNRIRTIHLAPPLRRDICIITVAGKTLTLSRNSLLVLLNAF